MAQSPRWKLQFTKDHEFDVNTSCLRRLSVDEQSEWPAEAPKKKKQKNNIDDQMVSMIKKKPNYFHRMYHEAEVKSYVNVFIRKLKQIIVRSENFKHPLFEEGWDFRNFNKLKTFNLSPTMQIIFNCFCIIITLFSCVYTTLVLVFPNFHEFPFCQAFSLLSLLFFLCEFLLNIFSRSSINFNNPKSSNFQFVKQALDCYLESKWLIIDVLLILLFLCDTFVQLEFVQYLKLLVLVKIYQIVFKIRNLQILFIRNCFKEQFWELMKIFAFNFVFAHFIAIVLLMIADPENSWMKQKGIVDAPDSEKYVWAYYWATTIMLTVGFGDLTATNVTEAMTLIFIETISCMVLAYNIANVSKIIDKITSYEIEKVENLKIFTQMQKKQHISEQISKKITNYIIQSAELKRNFNVNQENCLVNKLPKTFHEQLRKQSTNRLFGTIPFFRNLKYSKLQQLAIKIDKKLTHPEQIIVEAGSVPEVHILNKGHISYNMHRVGLKTHGKQIQQFKIQSDEYRIVSMYFFIRKSIKYDIKCKDYTILYSIPKKELQFCLSTNPYCFEYYCMYKDKDRFNSCDWEIQKCDLCTSVRHTYFQCPKLHFIPMKNIVIAKALFNGQVKFKISRAGRRRRISRQTISAVKYYSEIQNMFKKIQIIEKARQIVRNNKKKKTQVKWMDVRKANQNQNKDHRQDEKSKQNKKIALTLNIDQKKFEPSIKKTNYSQKVKFDENDQIKEEEDYRGSCETEFCQSVRQIETMMKIKCLKEYKNTKNQNLNKRISVEQVCKELTDKLKDQWAKTAFFTFQNDNDLTWILDLDVAHDYGFYFQNDNAGNLRKKWKKRKSNVIKEALEKSS